MASWSFEEVAAPSACWPSVNEIDGTIWEDMKGTEDQAVPEPGIVSSNAWISNSDQWRKLFTEVNDDDIGAGQCSFKKESPDSIAEFSIEKNLSALDVSTAELSLEDILSPALDIEGWDSLTLENAPDSLTTDEILASFGCNEENMNAANDIGGNLSLHETEMMLARDLDIFVKDSIDCEEIERDVDKSCPSAMSGGTSTGEFEFFESDTVTEKEGNFVKFAWENIGSLENMDNCIPQVESSNEENKELLSVSAKSSEEISLISDVLSSTCTLESKDRLDQTCLNSHAGNMTDVFYEDSCQPALESSVDLEGQERDISEILTELERHDINGVRDNEPFLEKEIYTHPRKDRETSRRIQDIEDAGRTIFEIAKESRISSQSCSITDNAYQSQSYSDKKRIDNKFKRHLSCRKESYSSSHRNSRAAYPERQTTVPSVQEIMPMQSPPLQSSASTSTHSFPSTELPSVQCSLSGSSSTISSVQQSQSILSGHQQIGTNLQSQQFEQQDKIASDSFGLPLLDSTSISTQLNMQGLLQGRQRCTKSAREKLEEELVRQNVLVGHFQTHSEYKQDVHTQANPEEKAHALSGCGDLTSMPTQPVCAVLPVKFNMISDVLSEKKELSIEAAVFYQLEDTIMKLDIGTRLLIRDALYRLARNAAERRAIGDDRSSSSSPLDLENSILYGSNSSLGSDRQPVPLPQRYIEVQTGETKTNPIDRAIADLLFHTQQKSQLEESMVMESSSLCDNLPSVGSSKFARQAPSIFHTSTGILHSQDMVSTLSSRQTHYPHRSMALEADTQLYQSYVFNQEGRDSTFGKLSNSYVASVSGPAGDLSVLKRTCDNVPAKPLSIFPLQDVGKESSMFIPLPPPIFPYHPFQVDSSITAEGCEANKMLTCLMDPPKADSQQSNYGENFKMANGHSFMRDANKISKLIPRICTAAPHNPFLVPNQDALVQRNHMEFAAVLPHG